MDKKELIESLVELQKKIVPILRSFPFIEKAGIYGSRARGDFNQFSDLDILIGARHITYAQTEVIRDTLKNALDIKIDLCTFENPPFYLGRIREQIVWIFKDGHEVEIVIPEKNFKISRVMDLQERIHGIAGTLLQLKVVKVHQIIQKEDLTKDFDELSPEKAVARKVFVLQFIDLLSGLTKVKRDPLGNFLYWDKLFAAKESVFSGITKIPHDLSGYKLEEELASILWDIIEKDLDTMVEGLLSAAVNPNHPLSEPISATIKWMKNYNQMINNPVAAKLETIKTFRRMYEEEYKKLG